MIMTLDHWISTKDELPKKGDSIVLTHPFKGERQYWVVDKVDYHLRDGKLIFGYSECDYWQHLELIND